VPSAAACSDAAAGAAAGAFAVACAAQQQQITARGTAGHLQGGLHRQSSLVHMRSSDTGSAGTMRIAHAVCSWLWHSYGLVVERTPVFTACFT
jgi:hypothetical protein